MMDLGYGQQIVISYSIGLPRTIFTAYPDGLILDFEEGIFVLFQIVILCSYEFHTTAA